MTQFIQLPGDNGAVEFVPLALIVRAIYQPDGTLHIRRLDKPAGKTQADIVLEGEQAQHVLEQIRAGMVFPAADKTVPM